MKTIYKYPLKDAVNLIKLPLLAKPLSFQCQDGVLCLWIEVDTDRPFENERGFYIFGTGHKIPEDLDLFYFGTTQQGPLVWHLYRGRL